MNVSSPSSSAPGPNAASCELRVTTTLVATVRAPASSVAVTRTDRELDSLTLDGLRLSSIAVEAWSLSVIVPVADAVPSVAFPGLLSVRLNVSSPSSSASSTVATVIVWLSPPPGLNVSVAFPGLLSVSVIRRRDIRS